MKKKKRFTRTSYYRQHLACLLTKAGYRKIHLPPEVPGDPPVILFELKNQMTIACACVYWISRSLRKKEVKEAVRIRNLYGSDLALIMTNGPLTRTAKRLARDEGVGIVDYIEDDLPSPPAHQGDLNWIDHLEAYLAAVED